MKQKHIAHLIPAAFLAMAGTQASAAGFQLLEQNASGLGNAYAGTAAVAEDASTIFFNPAGMTELKPREVSVGVDFVRPSFEFSDSGSTFLTQPFPVAASGASAEDAGDWAVVPNAYLSWALTDRLYVGVGIGAPFGLVTEYNDDWVGRAHALKFDIKTININPSIAFKVNDMLSVGFGLNWQRMEAEYLRVATVLTPPFAAAGLSTTTVKLDADDDSWGWNAGVLIKVSPTTKLGLSYRSTIEHKLEGSLSAEGTAAAAIPTTDASAKAKLPDTAIFSVAQQLSDRWEMLADLAWTGWSSIQSVDIYSAATPGTPVQSLETKFRDTWRVALGANYLLNDNWKLRFGVAYDQTPVRSQSERLVSLPDANRTWLSVGAQWKQKDIGRVDLGMSYLLIDKTRINNDQQAEGRGLVRGEYDSSVLILGAQYSKAF